MGRHEGWIFDVYPVAEGMRVWAILENGQRVFFDDPWRAPFVVDGADWPRARSLLATVRTTLSVSPRKGADLYGQTLRPVVEVRVVPPVHGALVKKLKRAGILLYNADIHLVQNYHYERGHFPLAFGRFEVDGHQLKKFELQDDPWSVNFSLPPLRSLHVALAGSEFAGTVNPNHAPRGGLILRHEELTHVLEGSPAEQLETLDRRIHEWDPDVLTTDWGDSYLMAHLLDWARRASQPLRLNRDPDRDVAAPNGGHPIRQTGTAPSGGHPIRQTGTAPSGGRSYMTYGRMMYQSGAHYLFGRWHLDLKNSFYFKECGWEGLYEIARIAKIPVQRAARTTIGTSLSSMQLDVALKRGLLIPLEKAQVEDFRPASALVVADKGGLVYEPDIGWFENIAEYDFVSMYPTLMVKHNISPETINCSCCAGTEGAEKKLCSDFPPEGAVDSGAMVPEIGHHLCQRRRGLVPEVLAPLLNKRAEYKRLYKSGAPDGPRFKARADAHKWCLVTCFGYLGYQNARFGKIEAHESVTAWGREVLLRAKECVEKRGFHVLHANVDCVWIQGRPGLNYEEIRRGIEAHAGAPVGLEGVYKWLRFCPSKTDPLSGVPNRYFGAFTNGELKVRGLALRRRDTPEIFKTMQKEMLTVLAEADDVAGCRGRAWELDGIAEKVRERIARGHATPAELAVTVCLSRAPADYAGHGPSAVAARRLAASGVELHAGETVRYVITSAGDKMIDNRVTPLAFMDEAADWDTQKYLELWQRCRDEILDGLVDPPSVVGRVRENRSWYQPELF